MLLQQSVPHTLRHIARRLPTTGSSDKAVSNNASRMSETQDAAEIQLGPQSVRTSLTCNAKVKVRAVNGSTDWMSINGISRDKHRYSPAEPRRQTPYALGLIQYFSVQTQIAYHRSKLPVIP